MLPKLKAVVLAAGRGNRISAVAKEVPKPLLPLSGRAGDPTFVDFHLRALSSLGVSEIFLVGNRVTHGTKTQAMRDIPATWILNPTEDLTTSGSGHSAAFAWKSPHNILDGASRVILMDADIVYDRTVLEKIVVQGKGLSKTLVCSDYRETQEEVMVFGDANGVPRAHGKGLLHSPLVTELTCLGEATGILLFEPDHHALLQAVTDWTMQYSTAKTRSEHEDLTQRMMGLGKMEAVLFGREHLFMEVDTPEEYEVLTKEVYPRLGF